MSPQFRSWGMAASAAALLLLPVYGQKAPGSTTPTTGAPTTTTPTTTTTTTTPTTRLPTTTVPTTTPNPDTTTNRQPTVMLITGKVVVDDGTALPSNTIIESLCAGRAHAEGYADGKGNFSVQLGQRSNVIDASEAGGSFNDNSMGGGPLGAGLPGFGGFNNRYSNCEIRARVAGYRSQAINLLNHGPMDNPDIGTILVHRLIGSDEEGTTVALTTLKAPKAAKKAHQKGLDLLKKGKTAEAQVQFETAVKIYPDFAVSWCALGRIKADSGTNAQAAHDAFETAVRLEPRWPEPKLELAMLAAKAKNWQELAALSDQVLRLNSFEYPQAFFFNAVANYNLNHMDVAEKSARSAQRLDTQHQYPQIAHVLGAVLAARKQYSAAAVELRNYLTAAPGAEDAPAVRRQLEEVERRQLSSGVRNEK